MKLIKNDRFVKKVNAIETTVTSDLVKKASYNTKIGETEKKIDHDYEIYITTQQLNKLTKENFTARLKEAKIATKAHIVDLMRKTDFDDKLKN